MQRINEIAIVIGAPVMWTLAMAIGIGASKPAVDPLIVESNPDIRMVAEKEELRG